MSDLSKAVELVPPCLFERLDAILVEESPMHPFGCATWELETQTAIDMAKDTVRDLQAALSAKSAELEKAREALEQISNSYLIEYRSRWIANIARQALGETND